MLTGTFSYNFVNFSNQKESLLCMTNIYEMHMQYLYSKIFYKVNKVEKRCLLDEICLN